MILLPDRRLKTVFDKLTKRIGEKQTLSLRKLSTSRKEEIQFGRFVGNKRVSVDFLEQELYSQMGNCNSEHCLLIEDTSQVGFCLERSIKDLGKVDKGQIKGFYIHPVLAIDAVNYACYGIASVEFISRPWPQAELTHNQKSAARSRATFEEKESYRWLDSIKKALPRCSNNTLAFAAWVIARLAGWSGYKSQRPAGPIDFLIGLQRFDERVQGFILAKGHT
tara:strand:+ start:149 stop:814 length:666 start_codon:yes stop_codon:yes gene_type:complete